MLKNYIINCKAGFQNPSTTKKYIFHPD